MSKTKSAETVQNSNLGRDLTVGSIPRHIFSFSSPMLIGGLFQILYSFINIFWVGKRIGKEAVAVITQVMPIHIAFSSIAIGLTLASTILVSQAYGRKDYASVKDTIRTSFLLNVMSAFICLLIASLVARPLMVLIQTPPGILEESVHYLRVFVWTLPLVFVTFLIAAVLRGVGDSITPLYFQTISLVITVVLDPILIFGWLGFPKCGLIGTAYANIIAQAIGLIAMSVYLERKKHIARLYWDSLGMHWETVKRLLQLGVPTMFQNASVSFAMVFLVSLVNVYGETADAAYGVAGRWDQMAFVPAMTMQMAIATLAGQNIGAGKMERIKEIFIWGVVLTCALTLAGTLMALFAPSHIMRLFTNDPGVVQIGIGYLRIVGVTYLLFAVMFVSNGIINGAGHTLATTIFSLMTLWFIRVPLAAYLSNKTGRIEGIWYSILASVLVGVIASLAYYFGGFWKRPVAHRRALESEG